MARSVSEHPIQYAHQINGDSRGSDASPFQVVSTTGWARIQRLSMV